jgi:hypothetical protein
MSLMRKCLVRNHIRQNKPRFQLTLTCPSPQLGKDFWRNLAPLRRVS